MLNLTHQSSEVDLSTLGLKLNHHRDPFEGHHAVDREGYEIIPGNYRPIPGGIVDEKLDLSTEQSRAWWRLTDKKYKDINRVIFGGQAGGGKSVLISLWMDYMCRTYPGVRGYLGRETLKDIKESVLLTFFDVIKLTGSEAKYKENHSKITYSNGSEIYLIETFAYPSDPNFDSFGSREYTFGSIEEGVTTVKRAADILISRTRYMHDKYDLYPKQLITLNPGDGWIKDDIVIPQMETGIPKRKSDIFIPATLNSNPNKEFRERYAKTLEENLSAFDRERLLNGNWNAKPKSGAEFLKNFNIDLHVGLPEYDPDLAIHMSLDENVNPHITVGLYQIKEVREIREIRQIAEICNKPPLNTRQQACLSFKKMFPGHKAGLYIYGDASSMKNETDKEYGENFFTDIMAGLKEYNPSLRVPSKNPPVVSKGGFLNLILEKCYRKISLIVHRDCKFCISDYAYAMESSDGSILKKKVTDPNTGIQYEKHGHGIDQLSYFICYAFASDFNAYLNGGTNPAYVYGSDRAGGFTLGIRSEF